MRFGREVCGDLAALNPPVEHTVLIGGILERASHDGRRYALSTHEYSNDFCEVWV